MVAVRHFEQCSVRLAAIEVRQADRHDMPARISLLLEVDQLQFRRIPGFFHHFNGVSRNTRPLRNGPLTARPVHRNAVDHFRAHSFACRVPGIEAAAARGTEPPAVIDPLHRVEGVTQARDPDR